MVTRLLFIGVAAIGLAACEPSGGAGPARRAPGPATDLVDEMAARGRLPQRDYVCRLTGGAGEDRPYGTLGVAQDRFTLVLKGGGRHEGRLTVDERRRLDWDGDLAWIDGEARRASAGRVNSEGETVEVALGFAPADEAGRDRIACVAEA